MFCKHCGAPLTQGQPCPCRVPNSINPVVAAIKQMGRAPLFLTICILQSVSVGLQLLSFFFSGDLLEQAITNQQALAMVNLPNDFPIFSLLATLAFWLVFATCRQNTRPTLSPGGITLARVLVTILQVVLFAGAGVAVLAAVVAKEELYALLSSLIGERFHDLGMAQPPRDVVSVAVGVILILTLMVLAVSLVATFAGKKALRVLQENFTGILTDRSIPMLVIVLGFILTVFNSFSLQESPLTAIANLIATAAWFMLCLWGLTYRQCMQALREQSQLYAAKTEPQAPCNQPLPLAEEPCLANEPNAAASLPAEGPAPNRELLPPADPLCPVCGFRRNPQHTYCPGCGTPIEQ